MNRPSIRPSRHCRFLAIQLGWVAFAITPSLRAEVEYNAKVERVIVPGDMLQVSVEEQSSINNTYGVGGDGTISLGELGRVEVAERSIADAETAVKKYLEASYFRQATVRISIAEFVEGEVTLMGAVGGGYSPGAAMDQGILGVGSIHRFGVKEGQLLSIFDAILQAGGLHPNANGKEVMILRWKPGYGLQREIFTVDVHSIFAEFKWENDQFLRPRDIVYVPFLKGDQSNQEILVLGSAGGTGYRRWYPGLNVLRLIATMGGLGPEGNNARILRPDGSGGYGMIFIDVGLLLGQADMSQNREILPGDIFYVPPSGVSTAGEAWIMGEVGQPGPIIIPPKGEVTLARIIFQRGHTKFANIKDVQISRRSPDGEIQKISFNVKDILDSGDFEKDFPIQDGDIIKVKEAIFPFSN
jgi:protein involved in polysaccharide export with SLBB domain